jgi:multiple sugar transport system permease protein
MDQKNNTVLSEELFSVSPKIDWKKVFGKIATYLLLGITSFLILLPLLLMISAAFKNEMEIFDYPINIIPKQATIANFNRLFFDQSGKLDLSSFPIYIFNSVKVTSIIMIIQLFTSTTAAYAFTKLKWKGREVLFLIYVSSIMIPVQITIIPQFIMVRTLGLYNTHLALILLGSFTAFGTFLVKQYFMTIPDSLLEAARIDGANEFYIYSKIMMALSKPVLAVQVIFSFRYFWNDFFVPMIYLSDARLKTIPLGMADFVTENFVYYGPQMAACMISVIPVVIIFLFTQKYFVEGVASGSIKG